MVIMVTTDAEIVNQLSLNDTCKAIDIPTCLLFSHPLFGLEYDPVATVVNT
jgi:hypothetical protein